MKKLLIILFLSTQMYAFVAAGLKVADDLYRAVKLSKNIKFSKAQFFDDFIKSPHLYKKEFGALLPKQKVDFLSGLAVRKGVIKPTEQLFYINKFSKVKHGDELLLKCLKSSTCNLNNYAKAIRSTTPAFRQGDNPSIKTVILLSAPGRAEAKLGRPAAGETGKTLQLAIEKLHKKDPRTFPSDKLDDYTIMNAVEKVHYKAKTGRTEGKIGEIIDSQNMNRINDIVKNYDNVIVLGDKAQVAIKNSSFKGKILSSNHPSKQSLNKKYKSDKETPTERNIDRVSQWTDSITTSMQ